MFPYQLIEKNSRVVIYGAGQIGQALIQEINDNQYCKIVLWVDQCYDNGKIKSTNALLNTHPNQYDYIILATSNCYYAQEMKWNLWDMNISREKIVEL